MEENKFFDFTSDKKFNLDEEYSTVFGDNKFIPANPNEAKLKDAEKIIDEFGGIYIEGLSLAKYEEVFSNLSQFLIKFRTDSEEVKSMTKSDRDKLFGYGKELFTFYQKQYSDLNFNFELSVKEWRYIDSTLTKKIAYNGQELFNYWIFMSDLLSQQDNFLTVYLNN